MRLLGKKSKERKDTKVKKKEEIQNIWSILSAAFDFHLHSVQSMPFLRQPRTVISFGPDEFTTNSPRVERE